jgi:hypothetical protein
MSAEADARLAFFEPATPTPTFVDPGPSKFHRLHGAITVNHETEIRITTQPSRGPDRPARLVIRRWYQRPDGRWWPAAAEPWAVLAGKDVQAFAKAVADAALALAESEQHT